MSSKIDLATNAAIVLVVAGSVYYIYSYIPSPSEVKKKLHELSSPDYNIEAFGIGGLAGISPSLIVAYLSRRMEGIGIPLRVASITIGSLIGGFSNVIMNNLYYYSYGKNTDITYDLPISAIAGGLGSIGTIVGYYQLRRPQIQMNQNQ